MAKKARLPAPQRAARKAAKKTSTSSRKKAGAGGAKPARTADPFSLVLPLGTSVRVVLEGVTDSNLLRYVAPEGDAAAETVGRLQIRRNRQWIDVPGVVAATSVLPGAAVAFAAAEPELALAEPPASSEPVPTDDEGASVSADMLGTRLSAVQAIPLADLRALSVKISTAMDPRLQLALANHRTGKLSLALASTTEDEVAVTARVKSVEAWTALSDVLPGSELGAAPDGSWLVTGRIPIERIEAVRADTTVLSLKASQSLHPALAATIRTMGVAPQALPAGVAPDGGQGVVVGIVDFGCDFAHKNFRHQDGTTRLLALWHQAGVAQPGSPFGYGRLYDTAHIDAALTSSNPYAALGYEPRRDDANQQGTHGTHVMDIAVGNGLGTGQAGVAPKADIVFVEAASTDLARSSDPRVVNQAFGDSVQLLEAVRFIFNTAGDQPCVVNISLGTNGGPHDGSSLVEQGLDAIVNQKPGRAVVIAASNSQLDGIHTSGQVPAAGDHNIVWNQRNDGGGEFELWYPGAARLDVTLVGPDGTAFGPVAPSDNLPVGAADQRVVMFISSRLNDPNNGQNMIGVWLAAGLSGEQWTIRLRSLSGQAVDYHAWLERNDRAQASFATPVPTHTLGSISTGRESVVVGSYDAHKPGLPLSSFSSAGPTRDGRKKPEISAPGHQVMAARSRTGTGVVRKSGTSMATPAVAGLIALILAEAHQNGQSLPITELRRKLLDSVARDPPAITANAWDPRYGFGRASARSI